VAPVVVAAVAVPALLAVLACRGRATTVETRLVAAEVEPATEQLAQTHLAVLLVMVALALRTQSQALLPLMVVVAAAAVEATLAGPLVLAAQVVEQMEAIHPVPLVVTEPLIRVVAVEETATTRVAAVLAVAAVVVDESSSGTRSNI
jgi:hypothetical protein